MTVIAHISDLHFGTEEPALATALLRDLKLIEPSLVAVSGDFTQRARVNQFRAACTYLDQIPFPRIAVPGNHDIPLYDVFRRFLSPLTRYRRYIHPDLNPWHEDEEVAILGLNTARSLTWKSGRISLEQISLIRNRFGAAGRSRFRVIMTHHPFIPPPGDTEAGIDLVGRAALALPVIDECRIDLLLAGHLHHSYTGDVRTYYPATNRSVIVAQAGTAISCRRREQPNGYNVIIFDDNRMAIAVRSWDGSVFLETAQITYDLVGQEWKHRTNQFRVPSAFEPVQR